MDSSSDARKSTGAETGPVHRRDTGQQYESGKVRPVKIRLFGFAGSAALAVGGLTAGALPNRAPFYLSPGLRHSLGLPAAGMICAAAGLTVLIGAWLRVRPQLAGDPRAARVVLVWWTAPLVLAPPMFSRDVYSYLAQGALVWHGLDAYAVGPVALGANPLVAQVHPLWLTTPAPYGPVFLGLAAAVVGITGTHLVAGVLGMRLVALVSVVALAYVVPRLAQRSGADPGTALWLGVLNPLVLVHAVAGGHNDMLMVALLAAGLLLASTGRLAPAVVLVTLAALVKAPAAIALAYLVPVWAARIGGRWRWPAGAAATVALAAVTVAAVSAGTGLGLGWLHALATPAIVHNGLSVSTDVGVLLGILPAARLAGAVLAAAVCVLAWLRRDRLGTPGAVGVALGAVVLLGPVVHPWYVIWALVPLAAGGRYPRAATVLSVALSLVILPHGVSVTARGLAEGLAGLALGLTVLALGSLPPRHSLLARRDVFQRQPVPVDAQPADDAGGDGGDHRVVPELLPSVDVGDVHLDERPAKKGARVPQGVRVV
jgi:alpha-1,6-mannosyltransferase